MCVFKAEREQEAEENAVMYTDLKAARETIEEMKQEKGIRSPSPLCLPLTRVVFCRQTDVRINNSNNNSNLYSSQRQKMNNTR